MAAGSISLLMVTGELLASLFWPGGDHRLAAFQAVDDLDQIALAAADLHEGLARHQLFLGALRPGRAEQPRPRLSHRRAGGGFRSATGRLLLLFGHDVDVVAVEAGHDRGLRQRDDVRHRGQLDAHARELAGAQLAVGVLHLGPHGHEARLRVDLRVDADDAALHRGTRPR